MGDMGENKNSHIHSSCMAGFGLQLQRSLAADTIWPKRVNCLDLHPIESMSWGREMGRELGWKYEEGDKENYVEGNITVKTHGGTWG